MRVQYTTVTRVFYAGLLCATLSLGSSRCATAQVGSQYAGPLDRPAVKSTTIETRQPSTIRHLQFESPRIGPTHFESPRISATHFESPPRIADSRVSNTQFESPRVEYPASESSHFELPPYVATASMAAPPAEQTRFQSNPVQARTPVFQNQQLPEQRQVDAVNVGYSTQVISPAETEYRFPNSNATVGSQQDESVIDYSPVYSEDNAETQSDFYDSGFPKRDFFGISPDDYCDEWAEFCECDNGCEDCGTCDCGSKHAHCLRKLFRICKVHQPYACRSCKHHGQSECAPGCPTCIPNAPETATELFSLKNIFK